MFLVNNIQCVRNSIFQHIKKLKSKLLDICIQKISIKEVKKTCLIAVLFVLTVEEEGLIKKWVKSYVVVVPELGVIKIPICGLRPVARAMDEDELHIAEVLHAKAVEDLVELLIDLF